MVVVPMSDPFVLPPLSLYVHIPWCVRKCPYCDFNSHALRGELPQMEYVAALLRDLEQDLPRVYGRSVRTVFLGGGTPSLFEPEHIDALLSGIRARIALAAQAEITLEANPGTVELARFRGYRDAGITRLSIGIQSFDRDKLQALGRIHGRDEALAAAQAARAAGFDNFNLDLMYGLPGQTVDDSLADLALAFESGAPHLSLYQLTLEPNTLFHREPPRLPDEDMIAAMYAALLARTQQAGYQNYEVSAYAKPGAACSHNLNYWQYGDYLGIGAGAHAKITQPIGDVPDDSPSVDGATPRIAIMRLWKVKQPQEFLNKAGARTAIGGETRVTAPEAAFEFMLNALRLTAGVPVELFTERTGVGMETIAAPLAAAEQRGLLARTTTHLVPTALGRQFLNDLVALFLPARAA